MGKPKKYTANKQRRLLLDLAQEYTDRLEGFSRSVCTGSFDRRGRIRPDTFPERMAIQLYTRKLHREMRKRLGKMGCTWYMLTRILSQYRFKYTGPWIDWDHPKHSPVKCPACQWMGMSDQGVRKDIERKKTDDYDDIVCPSCLTNRNKWVKLDDLKATSTHITT